MSKKQRKKEKRKQMSAASAFRGGERESALGHQMNRIFFSQNTKINLAR